MHDGNYVLRAYTSWMLGFNNQNIFSNYIYISNKTSHIVSTLSYKDPNLSTLEIQLRDTLQNSYRGMPVYYELMSKNKLLAKEHITTNTAGSFTVNVSTIPPA